MPDALLLLIGAWVGGIVGFLTCALFAAKRVPRGKGG